VALMTVEGEKDDITGIGQCEAAHTLCSALPRGMRKHHLQPKAGHYGIFNGSRYKADIVPEITSFIYRHDFRGAGALRRLFRLIGGGRGAEAPQPVSANANSPLTIRPPLANPRPKAGASSGTGQSSAPAPLGLNGTPPQVVADRPARAKAIRGRRVR
jgi:poly(3-hydroxybutyrate) depolymerase